MEENLVGYLLKALDADEQRDVERHLREHPEAEKRLEELRRDLDLLSHDAGDDEPPARMWVNALARVAEHKCRPLPPAPVVVTDAAPPGRSGWWRRADVLVAALLLLVIGALGVAWVARFRMDSQVVACQNNLRQFYQALADYADGHNGNFPHADSQPPRNFAGAFVPALNEAHAMPPGLSVSCPGDPRPPSDLTFADLDRISKERPEDFPRTIRGLAGCYAYSLGYRDPNGGGLSGLNRSMDGHLPLMADAPWCVGGNNVMDGNSTNHGGKGQNVLCLDGHVEFRTNRTIDPYLNSVGRVAAGTSPFGLDAPVGRSDAVPLPE
jgi:hypothetical protein